MAAKEVKFEIENPPEIEDEEPKILQQIGSKYYQDLK